MQLFNNGGTLGAHTKYCMHRHMRNYLQPTIVFVAHVSIYYAMQLFVVHVSMLSSCNPGLCFRVML